MNVLHYILTQGYPAFAELQLAAERHFLPRGKTRLTTLLCHDGPDASGRHAEIAKRFGAYYVENDRRLGHQAINQAIGYAVELATNFDLVVFHGRRYVPLWGILDAAAELADEHPGVPTFGNALPYGPAEWVVRNELLVLRPKAWQESSAPLYLQHLKSQPITEDVMLSLTRAARIVWPTQGAAVPVFQWSQAITNARHERPERRTLWSYWTRPEEYLGVASELGLTGYTADDFFVTDRLAGQALVNYVRTHGVPPPRRTT
jgi:hypothetical protein